MTYADLFPLIKDNQLWIGVTPMSREIYFNVPQPYIDEALEKKKANDERRKFENHHKFMMGGAVHKYFKECFSFEESEINEILEVAFKTAEVQKTISAIKRRAGVQVVPSPVESEVKSNEPEPTEIH